MLNKIFIMGRLTRDPELKTTQSGVSVVSFTLAVDRDFKNKQTGEKECDFINCQAWRNTAEFISKYFSKGRMAVAEGRLQMRNYEDKNGNKRIAAEVIVDQMHFGDAKPEGNSGSGYNARPASGPVSVPGPGPGEFAELSDDDGELPF